VIGIGTANAAQSPKQSSTGTSTPVTGVSAATPAAAPEPTSPTAQTSPSADVLKRARLAGYHIKKSPQGAIVFCKREAHLGSRFSTDSCIDESQLQEVLIRTKDQQDKMQHQRGAGTAIH
jgi:hypothetical protein